MGTPADGRRPEPAQYSNISVFDVDSPAELHDILWNLPLFPFMTVAVTALTEHPSALSADP